MLHLPKTISMTDSQLYLSQCMIENGKKLVSLNEQVPFLIKQLNKPYFEHAPLEMSSIEPTYQAALAWINKYQTLEKNGKQAMYFAYCKNTGACVGLISAKMVESDTVEILQSVASGNYQNQCEMIKILEKGLMTDLNIRKIRVEVNDNILDNMRHVNLKQLGYREEIRCCMRILGSIDYIRYVKKNLNTSVPPQSLKIDHQKNSFLMQRTNLHVRTA